MVLCHTFVAANSNFALAHAAKSWIVPGAEWKSTTRTQIDAHGGMDFKQGETVY
jgi:hypothetical protein